MKNHLYNNIENVRTKVNFDTTTVDGITVDNLDEYLLMFPQYRRAIYTYLKEIDTINLSELHKIVSANKGDELYNELKEDDAYRTIKYYADNREYYEKYAMLLDNILWDEKRLMIPSIHSVAADINEKILVKSTHWKSIQHRSTLYNPKSKCHNIQVESRKLTDKFFNKMVKGIRLKGLEVVKLYRKLVLFDKELGYAIVIKVDLFGGYSIKHTSSNFRGDNDNGVVEFLSNNKNITTLIDRFKAGFDEIRNYMSKVEQLKIKYRKQYNAMFDTIYTAYTEFKDKNESSFMDWSKLHFSFAAGDVVGVRTITDNAKFLSSMSLYKIVDGENTKIADLDFVNMNRYSVEEKVNELIFEGLMNIYSDKNKVSFDYLYMMNSNPSLSFRTSFMRANLLELSVYTEGYLEYRDITIEQYDQIKSNSNINTYAIFDEYLLDKKKPKSSGVDKVSMTTLAYDFKKAYPSKFHDKNIKFQSSFVRSQQVL